MSILTLLSNPTVLITILTLSAGSIGTLSIKACSAGEEASQLKSQLLQTQQDLSRCQVNLATIQSEIIKQSNEISKYNDLASRYKKELESKYTLPQLTTQPCSFDFTIANDLLTKQGRQ